MNVAEFLNEFQLEAGEKLDLIGTQLLRLERDATNLMPIREMFLAAHTIKGGAAMLRLADVEAVAHGVEDLLAALRDRQRTLDGATADLLFQSIDHLRALVAMATADAVGSEPDARVLSFAAQLRGNAGSRTAALADRAAHPPRALLLEDSPTVRELHRMLLQDAGYQVELCDDGHRAASRAQAERFDLVVSGVQNKGLSGFELAAVLSASRPGRDVPIVLTSSDADPELSRLALEAGARALVRKGSMADERLSDVLREIGLVRAA